MEGNGTKYSANGNKYIGQWKNDQKHGVGLHFDAKDQTSRRGEWIAGKRKVWLAQPTKTHISAGGARDTSRSSMRGGGS